MNSTGPYYQPATSSGYHESPLTQYTTPADEFSTLAEQLAAQVHPEDAQLRDLLLAASSTDGSQGGVPPFTPANSARGKRKRVGDSPTLRTNPSAKRAKQDPPHGSISAARAAGVHSAAALFRSPVPGSDKKYTRPPMSKLYASLKLTPEEFLHLQAAAKKYMLDPEHPERQEGVGIRAQGDNDMSKLRLFNTVREFLADRVGEAFFSEDAALAKDDSTDGPGFGDAHSPAQQRWVWPRDGNQIVSLVTPLMRRMVTNERQRMYANESRKGGKGTQCATGAGGELLDPRFHETTQGSPTPSNNVADASSGTAAGPVAHNADHSQQPPPPRCSTNVIQFIFTYDKVKLLRFDWPDPDGSPKHAHMTFDKLTTTVTEHASGVKAAISDANLSSRHRWSPRVLSPHADMARQKAAEALMKAREQRSTDIHSADEQGQPIPDATTPAVDLSEELRRELQSQVNEEPDEAQCKKPPEEADAATSETSEEINAHLKVFAPSGITEIMDAQQWDAVREEVAQCLWLEGCLRVAVDLS